MAAAAILWVVCLVVLFAMKTPDRMNALWAALFILANVANAILFFVM